jgi:hypothetical protein
VQGAFFEREARVLFVHKRERGKQQRSNAKDWQAGCEGKFDQNKKRRANAKSAYFGM